MKNEPVKNELQLYRELSEHAQRQIDRAWKAYAILAALLGALLAASAALFFGSISNFRESLRTEYRGEMESAQALLKEEVRKAFAADNVQRAVSEEIGKRLPVVVEGAISNRTMDLDRMTVGEMWRKVAELDATMVRGVYDPKMGVYKLLMGTNSIAVPSAR
jgi:hypothetical protein